MWPDQPNEHGAVSENDVTGVILAGGCSSRMGHDKATLRLAGETLFARTLAMLHSVVGGVLIAGDRPDLASPAVASVADIFPGSPLGGIHAGLRAALTPWILVVPCDLARPDSALARFLLAHREGVDVVVPVTSGGFEPVFALYHKNCLQAMETMLARGQCRIFDLYRAVRVRCLQASVLPAGWDRALVNLNAPEDLRRAIEEGS